MHDEFVLIKIWDMVHSIGSQEEPVIFTLLLVTLSSDSFKIYEIASTPSPFRFAYTYILGLKHSFCILIVHG